MPYNEWLRTLTINSAVSRNVKFCNPFTSSATLCISLQSSLFVIPRGIAFVSATSCAFHVISATGNVLKAHKLDTHKELIQLGPSQKAPGGGTVLHSAGPGEAFERTRQNDCNGCSGW